VNVYRFVGYMAVALGVIFGLSVVDGDTFEIVADEASK
jgi:hypothetical protein